MDKLPFQKKKEEKYAQDKTLKNTKLLLLLNE